MTQTAFYSIDQENLPKQYWHLADTFAELHALASSQLPLGVLRITVADLMVVLDWLDRTAPSDSTGPQQGAAARISAAISSGKPEWSRKPGSDHRLAARHDR